MKRKKHTPAQIIDKLRTVERLVAEGQTAQQAVQSINVSEQTYYRWRRQYGNMDKSEAKKMREVEKENQRLKKLVADLTLRNDILKEALEGKY